MSYPELIDLLQARLEIATMDCSQENGACRFVFDDGDYKLTDLGNEDEETSLEAEIGPVPRRDPVPFEKAVLEANFLGRGADGMLLYVNDDERLVIEQTFSRVQLDADGVIRLLNAMAVQVEAWRQLLAKYIRG